MNDGGFGSYGNNSNAHGAAKDAYASKNAYKVDNAYSNNDPYKTNDTYAKGKDPYARTAAEEENKKRPFIFWLLLKEELQDANSGDMDRANDKRTYRMDKDLFVVQMLTGIALRGAGGAIFGLIISVLSYVIAVFLPENMKVIPLFFNFMIILWFLFFPTWQTVSASSFAISASASNFYTRWRKAFKGYQWTVAIAYFISIAVVLFLASNGDAINSYLQNKSLEVSYLSIENDFDFISSLIYYLISMMITFVLYLMFYKKAETKAKEDKLERLKSVDEDRLMSPIERFENKLDGDLQQ